MRISTGCTEAPNKDCRDDANMSSSATRVAGAAKVKHGEVSKNISKLMS